MKDGAGFTQEILDSLYQDTIKAHKRFYEQLYAVQYGEETPEQKLRHPVIDAWCHGVNTRTDEIKRFETHIGNINKLSWGQE